jgi:dTDP-glucose pyrophosphorylase
MKVIIPMAGNGSRFTAQGYKDPKPFIPVNGEPMIRAVVESIGLQGCEHIFLVREDHLQKYSMRTIFPDYNITVMPIDKKTQGAACTVAMAYPFFINNDEDFLIVNSDQLVDYNPIELIEARSEGVDGCIWCFIGEGNNWSYVRLDVEGYVTQVAEKKQISNLATGGMYYWKSFKHYLKCVDRMIVANDRVNNEFYVAPVYNHMPKEDKVIVKMLNSVVQLGTPEELRHYENQIRLY